MANKDKNDDIYWYKDAIIYELHIKAFFDKSGDGIGDFEGLLEKLDYLEDIGVTAIWLLPFYPSPLKDDGYDIADYYNINPSYGDIKIFKKFIKEAHSRNLKVITELVVNHTSDQHPWFQRARKSPPGSNERDYYVWTDDPNKYKETRIIFTDTEPSNWTWDPEAQAYFWHRFFSHQPDLNFENPNVQKEVFKALDFWFEMGVDGFRLDAVPYLFEREGTNCENLPETHAFLKKLRRHVDENHKNKLLLAEANMWPEDAAAYFGDGDECHMNYHFPIMPRMFMAIKMEDRYPITDIIDQTPEIPESCQWAIFLRNHDELTLEMVTDEERDYMYKMYTKDNQARINVGIRHRLAPLLDNDRRKIELMNVLLFSLPGTPVLYYGDEIGMGDNFYLGDRDGVRTPMQWSADKNAGFSKANPQQLYLPVIIDPQYKYESINVESQQMNPSSLLWWMKRIISMRKQFKAFGRGSIEFLSPSNSKVIAYIRSYEEEKILVIGNLSRFPQEVELDVEEYENYIPIEVFSRNKFSAIGNKDYRITLAPYGYYWFQLEKEKQETIENGEVPPLTAASWKDLFKGRSGKKLSNEVLPLYLHKCRWFGAKSRIIQSVNISTCMSLKIKEMPVTWVIMDIIYNEGLPESYQLPLAFMPYHDEEDFKELPQQAIITQLTLDGMEGVLFDAVFSEDFRHELFNNFIKNRSMRATEGSMNFDVSEKAGRMKVDELYSRVLGVEQSNTSIIFSDCYFLKLYRKLEPMINPDLEVTRYLSDKTDFENIPRYRGAMVYRKKNKSKMVLGMMQELVPNQGDAWEYTKDVMLRYFERIMISREKPPLELLQEELSSPLKIEDLSENMQELLGNIFPERVKLLAERTAEMHLNLASRPEEPNFEPEPFSLHYQRSLYSALQSLTRSSFQNLEKSLSSLGEELQAEGREILNMKNNVLKCFKKVFHHKIDNMKIRTHGDYHLGQVLWTGKDFVIIDFEGEPAKPYSERRLKRAALRDVAGMIRSFHYTAYSALLHDNTAINSSSDGKLEDWAELWYHCISRLFLSSYRNHIGKSDFIPMNDEDFKILLNTFLLEKAVYELDYELNNRPAYVMVPLRGIRSIIENCYD